jgi:hypothetical protein
MHFKEILTQITGVSVPIFGIQWKPVIAEVTVARELIRILEDKRVLYRPEEMEGATYCLHSVENIRHQLTSSLQQVTTGTHIAKQLDRMRRSAREFGDVIGSPKFGVAPHPVQRSILRRELTKLRATFGSAVGALAIAYGLDVEDELASVIPFNNAV